MTTPPLQPWNQPSSDGSAPPQNPGGFANPNQTPEGGPSLWSSPPTGAQPGQYGATAQYGQTASPGGAYPAPGQYGAPGQTAAPGQYGAPGQFAAPGQYGTPGQSGAPGQYTAPGQYGAPEPTAQPTGWSAPTGPDGIGQTAPGAPAGYYLASDGQYYPLADQPTLASPGVPPAQPAQPKRKRRGVLVAAGVAVALAVAGGGAYVLLTMRGGGGGAASPEDAAEALLVDLASLDFTQVASKVAPSEQTLFDPLVDAAADAQNQNEEQKQFQEIWNDAKAAVTVEFKDLKFSSQALAEGVDRTVVTGGSVSLDADTDKLADAVMDLYDLSGSSASSLSSGLDGLLSGVTAFGMEAPADNRSEIKEQLDQFFPVTKDVEDLVAMSDLDDLFVVTVKEDGKWFTSASMTLAQYAYEDSGMDNAALGDPIPDGEMKGASSPEDALGNLVAAWDAAAQNNDLRELAKALPTAESRLLAVYGPALMSDGGMSLEGASGVISGVSGTKHSEIGGHARVTLDSLSAAGGMFEFSRADDNWTIKVSTGYSDTTVTVAQDGGKTWRIGVQSQDEYSGDQDVSLSITVPSKGVVEGTMSGAGVEGSFAYQDGCVTTDMAGASQKMCGDELGVDLEASPLNQIDKLPDLKGLLALSAVKGAGGDWYISPTASLLDMGAFFSAEVF